MHKTIWGGERQTDHRVLTRKLELILINQKEIVIWRIFDLPLDVWMKMKESVKISKYLPENLKVNKKMKVTVISNVTLVMTLKCLEKRLWDRRSEVEWIPCRPKYYFFSSRFVSVHVVHPYSSIDVTAAWKKLRFILSVRSDFHIVDSLLIAVHAFVNLVSMSFSVDSTLLPRYVNLSTSLRGVPSRVEMSPVWL